MDIDILTSIVHPEHESRLEQFDEEKQLKENVSNVLQQFQQQMRVEKNKEKELDDMYPYVFLSKFSFRLSKNRY